MIPGQLLIPGLPGGRIAVIITILILIVVAFIGRWVYHDAKRRGSKWAWQWGVGIGILLLIGVVPGIIGIIYYISTRDDV